MLVSDDQENTSDGSRIIDAHIIMEKTLQIFILKPLLK